MRTAPREAERTLSVDEALARILERFSPLPAEEKPILDALGQVLAEDVRAPNDVPPFANSAMDGFAVRAEDVARAPVQLPVAFEVAAGAAGGTRLRTALLTVLAAVLDEGADAEEAVSRPRFHPVGRLTNAEPGLADEALAALRSRGLEVRVWEARHHYFGGVSLITRSGGAGDPRRNGAAAVPARSPGAGAP
jgi:hypothetical protein